jgi:hypothetical protein
MMAPHNAALARHPATRSDSVRGIEASVSWIECDALAFAYSVKGDAKLVRIPPPRLPRRGERLWEHTCFEAFIAVEGGGPYYEFNFAPSGEWAAYHLTGYRKGAPLERRGPGPRITVRRSADSIDLDALIGVEWLPPLPPGGRWRLALCAVIEEQGGECGYWALRHPPGKPDFHHPDGFTLEIRRPAL